MPRLTSAVPIYRHHKASGQAVVTPHGVDHYLGPNGSASSNRPYEKLIREQLADDERRPRPDRCQRQDAFAS